MEREDVMSARPLELAGQTAALRLPPAVGPEIILVLALTLVLAAEAAIRLALRAVHPRLGRARSLAPAMSHTSA